MAGGGNDEVDVRDGNGREGVAKAALVLHRRCQRDRCAAPSPGEPIARLRSSAER